MPEKHGRFCAYARIPAFRPPVANGARFCYTLIRAPAVHARPGVQAAPRLTREERDMRRFLSKTEREELESLKRDLVNPVKRFAREVYHDTVGDAKTFYSARARQAQRNAGLVRQRTEERMAVLAQRRNAQLAQRRVWLKRAALILALVLVLGLIFVSFALSARAEWPAETDRTALPPAVETGCEALETHGALCPGDPGAGCFFLPVALASAAVRWYTENS